MNQSTSEKITAKTETNNEVKVRGKNVPKSPTQKTTKEGRNIEQQFKNHNNSIPMNLIRITSGIDGTCRISIEFWIFITHCLSTSHPLGDIPWFHLRSPLDCAPFDTAGATRPQQPHLEGILSSQSHQKLEMLIIRHNSSEFLMIQAKTKPSSGKRSRSHIAIPTCLRLDTETTAWQSLAFGIAWLCLARPQQVRLELNSRSHLQQVNSPLKTWIAPATPQLSHHFGNCFTSKNAE